jgi:glycopeptide antibiotics resistance protein
MLFVPLGAAIALLFARWAWPFAIVAGFLLSSAVEFAQTTIPGRVPDLDDVFWNTAGGAVGVIAVTVPRLIAALIRRTRQRGRATRT